MLSIQPPLLWSSDSRPLVLINGTLFDGTGADPVSKAVIVIQEGKIKPVGSPSETVIATNAQIIDINGAAILPGFINTHVHFCFDWWGMPITEITLMQKAGMTPMQIIVSATRNAAHVCGLGNELGTIEDGKIADIIVVDGNPLEDIAVLQKIRIVIHNGEII